MFESCDTLQMAELRGNLSAEQVTVKQRQEELATKERETEELRAEIQGLIFLLCNFRAYKGRHLKSQILSCFRIQF